MTLPPPAKSCPTSPSNSQRFKAVLEAPTANVPRTEASPLTYLNKSQCYTIILKDTEEYDGDITSTITLMFHYDLHRKASPNYWKSWLNQQRCPENARAIDIDPARCERVHHIERRHFDRVSFRWNGKTGAVVAVWFNCLSTDFSRIKGIKGFPLRLHIQHQQRQEQQPESAFCRIKLFRDKASLKKGAERKNKDDCRHIEKQLEKFQFKRNESHPLPIKYAEAKSWTVFYPSRTYSPPPTPDIATAAATTSSPSAETSGSYQYNEQSLHLFQKQQPVYQILAATNTVSGASELPIIAGKRSFRAMGPSVSTTTNYLLPPFSITTTSPPVPLQYPYFPDVAVAAPACTSSLVTSFAPPLGSVAPSRPFVLDIEPTYVPPPRRFRSAKRCLFPRFGLEPYHRAIYLDELTVEDLKTKLAAKIRTIPLRDWTRENEWQCLNIKQVVRQVRSKKDAVVRVDDDTVNNMSEEQEMQVEAEMCNDGTMTLILRY
ncbi:CP2 transcription factor-domain-containing protein [Dichotomocladium elegans]|nr:CP2 transcription factor-domain-containing protein [Dichotomocladium elegans]